jgi:para-nitrobenzyl esterase
VRAVGRHAATAGQPTWVYCFDYVAEHLRSTIAGATHASDVAYSFGTLGAVDPEANAADRQMADIVADYWANFVKAHDPNGPALPSWPRAGTTGDPILTFENDRIFAGPDTRRARLDAVEVSATT